MIRLRTLGLLGLRTVDGAEVSTVLAQPKRLALLAYLAIAEPRGYHRRDTLLGVFWPELDEGRGRAALSQALYYLRQSLGAGAVVSRGKAEVGVAPDRLWCDAVAFDERLEDGDTSGLRAALDLYRGDLLPGFFLSELPGFERWLEEERSRLRGRAAEAAWTLSARAEAAASVTEAVEWGRRALALSAYDEAQLRRLIDLLDRAGDRAGAIQVYEETAQQLSQEYQLELSPETQQRIAEIRSREEPNDGAVQPPGVGTEGSAVAASPPDRSASGTAPGVGPAPEPAELVPSSARADRYRRRRAWLGVATAAAVMAVLLMLTRRGPGPTGAPDAPGPAGPDPNRVAVLPLTNISPDTSHAYLADGLTAELISRLARLRDLRVLPLGSVLRYQGSDLGIAEIGRELNVGTVIEGNARPYGDSVRLTVYLTHAETEELRWSETYDASFSEVLAAQRRIAEDVALELRVANRARMGPAPVERRHGRVAMEEYLLGRAALVKDQWQSVGPARDHFLRAIEVDSQFAEAWSGLAAAYTGIARAGVAEGPGPWEGARRAAERALAYDEELPEAHAVLGSVHSMAYWDPDSAERHFRRAIALDPSYSLARIWYGSFLRNRGRAAEALEEFRQARRLEPRAILPVKEEAQLLYLEGRLEEAIDLLRRYLATMPPELAKLPEGAGTPGGHPFWLRFTLALAFTEKGDYGAALAALDTADPERVRGDALALRGYIYARSGRPDQARRVLGAMDRSSGEPLPISDFHMAIVHVGLGEHDRAVELLESAAMAERSRLVMLLGVEPKLRPLRGHPAFETLLRRLGLADTSSTEAGGTQ